MLFFVILNFIRKIFQGIKLIKWNDSTYYDSRYLAYLTNQDQSDFNILVESDKSVILSTQNKTSKYMPVNNICYSTQTEIRFTGKFYIQIDNKPAYGGISWSVKFSFYITFRVNT